MTLTKSEQLEFWAVLLSNQNHLSESEATEVAKSIHKLLHHLTTDYAAIAFYQKSGQFKLVKGTLQNYVETFQKPFKVEMLNHTIPFWCADTNLWATFEVENFLGWKVTY